MLIVLDDFRRKKLENVTVVKRYSCKILGLTLIKCKNLKILFISLFWYTWFPSSALNFGKFTG